MQLFVNYPEKPDHYILLDNQKLDKEKIIKENIYTAKANTEGKFVTKSFITPISVIKDAIITCNPNVDFWVKGGF